MIIAARSTYAVSTADVVTNHTHTSAAHTLIVDEIPSYKHWILGAAYEDENMSAFGAQKIIKIMA